MSKQRDLSRPIKRSEYRIECDSSGAAEGRNNLGAPVVSFYSACQVRRMVTDSGGTIVAEHAESERLGHADAVIRKANLSIVAQRLGV